MSSFDGTAPLVKHRDKNIIETNLLNIEEAPPEIAAIINNEIQRLIKRGATPSQIATTLREAQKESKLFLEQLLEAQSKTRLLPRESAG